MLWLFGQIWLWLLLAFLLGAGLTALVLGTRLRAGDSRERARDHQPEPRWQRHDRYGTYDDTEDTEDTDDAATGVSIATDPEPAPIPAPVPPPVEPPTAVEQTELIPAATDVEPGEGYQERRPSDEVEPPDHGRQEGTLPPQREWHVRNEWPDEEDVAAIDDYDRQPEPAGHEERSEHHEYEEHAEYPEPGNGRHSMVDDVPDAETTTVTEAVNATDDTGEPAGGTGEPADEEWRSRRGS